MDDDFDAQPAREADDRPRGVSKAKLSDIDLKPKLAIFYRPHRSAPMVPLDTSFSKEAAKIFCDRIRSEIEDSNAHSFVITGGDQSAYKMIFAWINDCVQTQSIEKFPDIPEPEHDPFTPTINIIVAGDKLGVPAGSLSFHLRKRLNGCARKQLMPLSQVRDIYDFESEMYSFDLRDIACASVLNAWWDARLDETVTPRLMEELSDMRDEVKELDDDLHEACKTREEEVRKKWAEKKAKRLAEQAEQSEPAGDGDWDKAPAASGNWDTPSDGLTQAPTPASTDWENSGAYTASSGAFNAWDKPQTHGNEWDQSDGNATTSKDWADEMNDPAPNFTQSAPNPQW